MIAVQRLFEPVSVGSRRLPGIGLVVLAAIGLSLLAILATTEWQHFNDEHAYWLAGARLAAGQPLYDPTAAPNTPFAYWYPPTLAQVLAPVTSFLSADAFSVALDRRSCSPACGGSAGGTSSSRWRSSPSCRSPWSCACGTCTS